MKLPDFGTLRQGLEISARLPNRVNFTLHRLIGEQQAHGCSVAAYSQTDLAPVFLTDADVVLQAVGRFNEIVPIHRAVREWDAGAESLARCIESLFGGDVLKAGG